MKILGLSAFGDGSGAGLVSDGRALAAAAEEHFTRRPLEAGLPRRAVRFCLGQAGCTAREVDQWVFYEKPLRRFERSLAGQLATFPRSWKSFGPELFSWLGERLWLKSQLAAEFGIDTQRIRFTSHHQAHAAAAFFLSPFDEAAVLVVDGLGEWATTSFARGAGARLEGLGELHHPHSLGLASRAVTHFLGLAPRGHQERLAALAAHGEPRWAPELRTWVRSGVDGHVELDVAAFVPQPDGSLECGAAWSARFGAARRATDELRWRGADSQRRDADLAASFQLVLEEAVLGLARELHRRAPLMRLCLAGEVAGNPAVVARLVADGPFDELFVPPACDDAGAALGAALAAHALAQPAQRPAPLEHAFLGEQVFGQPRAGATLLPGAHERRERMAAALQAGHSLGWVRGRAECGPRALGARVLLADPRRPELAARLSRTITRQEEYLSYAPAVPAERAHEFFELPRGARGPARWRQVLLRALPAAQHAAPAALRVDRRALVYLVDAAVDPEFHGLLTRFGELGGAPLLVCAPLEPHGEPPVRGEEDALALFDRSGLDLLVVEQRLYARS